MKAAFQQRMTDWTARLEQIGERTWINSHITLFSEPFIEEWAPTEFSRIVQKLFFSCSKYLVTGKYLPLQETTESTMQRELGRGNQNSPYVHVHWSLGKVLWYTSNRERERDPTTVYRKSNCCMSCELLHKLRYVAKMCLNIHFIAYYSFSSWSSKVKSVQK